MVFFDSQPCTNRAQGVFCAFWFSSEVAKLKVLKTLLVIDQKKSQLIRDN